MFCHCIPGATLTLNTDEAEPDLHVIRQLPQHFFLVTYFPIPVFVLEVLDDAASQIFGQVSRVGRFLQSHKTGLPSNLWMHP